MKKLTAQEREAVEMLRQLDARQRHDFLGAIKRQIVANRITTRVGKLRKLRIVDDRKIVRAFGAAPIWKAKSGS